MTTLTEADRAYFQDVRTRRDELWAWLGGQPQQVSAAIALRIGFRALPFVVGEPAEGRFTPKEGREIASSFRYIALGRLSARRPSLRLNAFATLLNSIAYAKGSSATGSVREASRATPSGSPLETPADAARNAASRASHAAMFSATSPAGPPWDAIAADRARIAARIDPLALLDEPMWLDPGSTTGELPEPHAGRWNAMRAALEGEDASWRVWTAWYQDRLQGALAPADAVEYLRVTLCPTRWPGPKILRRTACGSGRPTSRRTGRC